jgi:hypothetical protein
LRIDHNHIAHPSQRTRLQPQRFERYIKSDASYFEPKAAGVIGLYVNPPQYTTVLAADEKIAIQVPDRL